MRFFSCSFNGHCSDLNSLVLLVTLCTLLSAVDTSTLFDDLQLGDLGDLEKEFSQH